ncbi:hypothetical protein RchiOBHm_Chr5g0018811 [Rosa chinensis]|uniref:Uncharacterized protein n=1 Tax=Rosa chinensis TaxID=74649 RepID=A0A2P6Q6V2_ROSCH|nr:hypothetical protein RchiOBHm_Chr5g0018811 [Rosa chinensis]
MWIVLFWLLWVPKAISIAPVLIIFDFSGYVFMLFEILARNAIRVLLVLLFKSWFNGKPSQVVDT